MSTNGQVDLSYKPKRPPVSALACDAALPLAANEDVSYGQIALVSASTGNAQLADDETPNMIAGGTANMAEQSASSTTAGAARLFVSWGSAVGRPASTTANDTPSAASIGVPAWVAGASTYGLLTHTGTVAGATLKNRSIGGLFLGLDPDSPVGGTARPYVWEGPVAQAVARGVMVANAFMLASTEIADAAANTAIAEKAIRRPKIHGRVTSVELTGAAIAADDTDYITVTIAKRDGAGGGATTIATYDSRAANNGAVTAFVPAAFTLGTGTALDLLESDIVTVTTVKGGSGKVITGTILVNGKAI